MTTTRKNKLSLCMCWVFLLYLCNLWSGCGGEQEEIDLHIGGLFPISGTGGWQGGQACLPAAKMALEDVNNAKNLLNGYRLLLHWNDSKCDPGLASSVLYGLIYDPPTKLLVIGGCSPVCSTIAETAKMYNLVVVGYGSSSPALSDRTRFTTFFRTHPPATVHNPTRIEIFKLFGWTRIAVILEAEEVFQTTGKDLESRCKEAGIEIATRVPFLNDAVDAVRSLARQDARIIIGMFYEGAARKVMCEAYKQNLYGKQHVWFLIGWYEDNWYVPVPGINCTEEEMLTVLEGHITTEAIMLNKDSKITINGQTAHQWQERYNRLLNSDVSTGRWNVPARIQDWNSDQKSDNESMDPSYFCHHCRYPQGYQEAPLAYDSVWAVALALNATIEKLVQKNMRIESFDYHNKLIMQILKSSMESVDFLGVSGNVRFSQKGDRIAWTMIEQFRKGEYKTIGYFDTLANNMSWVGKIEWALSGKPPADRTIIKISFKTISQSLYYGSMAVSAAGILCALGLIFFNFKFRKYRYIELSYPMANNFMLFGCIICLLATVFFGMDGQKIRKDYFIWMCYSRAFFISIGFSLYFGSMFAKTWITYRLSTSTSSKRKKIKNTQVYLMLSAFCLIDIAVLVFWFFRSPMSRKVETFDLESPENTNDDVKIQPQLEHCDANLIWYGIIFGWKGLLMIFGLFLAYETRSAKVRLINDARFVGMSVYNVVILCTITGPVSLVISNQVNAHFAFIAFTIFFCCFMSMALVFIPKMTEICRRRGAHAMTSGNGTINDTMSTKEEEEKLERLIQENDDLRAKITEKENQIEEVSRKIDAIMKELKGKSQLKGGITIPAGKKAVRIQEPEHLGIMTPTDPVSDSGYSSSFRRLSSREASEV